MRLRNAEAAMVPKEVGWLPCWSLEPLHVDADPVNLSPLRSVCPTLSGKEVKELSKRQSGIGTTDFQPTMKVFATVLIPHTLYVNHWRRRIHRFRSHCTSQKVNASDNSAADNIFEAAQ